MKKINLLLIFTFLWFTSCSKNDDEPVTVSQPITFENNTVVNIPDRNSADFSSGESTIAISQNGTITNASKVSVELDIAHTFGADVAIELIAPNGDKCGLINKINGTEEFITGNKLTFNALHTAFLAPINGVYVTGNYAPTFAPDLTQIETPVSITLITLSTFFTGKNINGMWKLKMYDCAPADVGKINSWKIKFDTGAFQ
jgi:subtilisin-like proprotein convertase family protein